MITKHEGIIIEAENEKQAADLVQSYFITNLERFVESPEDMISKVERQELIIDKVKKFWKHQTITKILNIIIFYYEIDNCEKRGIYGK